MTPSIQTPRLWTPPKRRIVRPEEGLQCAPPGIGFSLGAGGRASKGTSFDPATVAWTGWWRDQSVGSPNVTQWTDLSGNGRHFTASANWPQVGAAINGQPTISWDGAAQIFVSSTQLSAVTSTTAFTIFIVFNATSVSPGAGYGMSDAGAWSFFSVSGAIITARATARVWDSAYQTATSTAVLSASTTYVFESRLESSLLYARVNGGNEVSVAFGSIGGTNTLTAGNAYPGRIAEMAIINSALPQATRDAYTTYAQSRYGF